MGPGVTRAGRTPGMEGPCTGPTWVLGGKVDYDIGGGKQVC